MRYIYTKIKDIKALPDNCTWAPIDIEMNYPDGFHDIWGEGFIKQPDGLHHPDGNVSWTELEELFSSNDCQVYAVQEQTEGDNYDHQRIKKNFKLNN